MTKRKAVDDEGETNMPPQTRIRTDVTPQQLTVSAALTTLLDPDLMPHILGYVSMPRGDCWERTHHATQFIRTVASVCRLLPSSAASPPLVERFGPSNRTFWREMLFKYFDFSVRRSGKNLNSYDVYDLDISGHPPTRRHAQLLTKYHEEVRRGLHEPPPDADGGKFLVENYYYWHKLHVCFRPSQYGFLQAIQAGKKPITSFPARIDPYGLFHDLAVLVDELRIHSTTVCAKTGEIKLQCMQPVLLDSIPTKITPQGSSLIEMCGIVPTFWDDSPMVSDPWRGLLSEHLRSIRAATYEPDLDPEELVKDFLGRLSPVHFGAWRSDKDKPVKAAVRKLLCDWRHVRIVNNQGPQFYVGKRPDTHRWVGFVQF